jgi:hypothetical protein
MPSRAVAFLASARPDESRHFYANVVGPSFVEESEFAIVFDAHGTPLRIQKVREVTVAPYTSFGLELSDIDSEVDRLVSNGIRGHAIRSSSKTRAASGARRAVRVCSGSTIQTATSCR